MICVTGYWGHSRHIIYFHEVQ